MICPQLFSAFVVALFLLLTSFGLALDAFAENAKLSNESLLWGPYRPNLYFGIRPRIPKSLTTGLLWARVDSFETVQNSMLSRNDYFGQSMPGDVLITLQLDFRHTCEQHEGMHGYGWDEYDVRYGGRQTIHDAGNSIDVTTEFVKIPGGQHGGSWGARIKGTPREDAPERLMTTMIFYAAMDGFGSLGVKNEADELGIEGAVALEGSSDELGSFTLEVTEGPESNRHPPPSHQSYAAKPLDRTMVASLQVPADQLWQAKRMSDQPVWMGVVCGVRIQLI